MRLIILVPRLAIWHPAGTTSGDGPPRASRGELPGRRRATGKMFPDGDPMRVKNAARFSKKGEYDIAVERTVGEMANSSHGTDGNGSATGGSQIGPASAVGCDHLSAPTCERHPRNEA